MPLLAQAVVALAFFAQGLVSDSAQNPPVTTIPTEQTSGAAAASQPTFLHGFAELAAQLGASVMGQPLEHEHPAHDADAVQRTTTGLAVWRLGELPSFTNGAQTFTLRDTDQRSAGSGSPSGVVGAVARADCIIGKESGGRDIPNRQGSGATGPGQYMPSTWVRHSNMYRQATGYTGSLNLHNLQDVRRVMAWILAAHPSTRREWTVGGC